VSALTTRIERAAALLLGWRYPPRPTVPVYPPTTPPGFPLRAARADHEQAINCSTMTAWLLYEVYRGGWEHRDYGDLQVFADRLPAHPDAPILAVERRGVGVRVDALDQDGWHLVQGWWRRSPPGGHALIAEVRGSAVRVLESTSLGLLGPRWRTTTEAELRSRFAAGIHFARLREP
jgi:hypothetical protein